MLHRWVTTISIALVSVPMGCGYYTYRTAKSDPAPAVTDASPVAGFRVGQTLRTSRVLYPRATLMQTLGLWRDPDELRTHDQIASGTPYLGTGLSPGTQLVVEELGQRTKHVVLSPSYAGDGSTATVALVRVKDGEFAGKRYLIDNRLPAEAFQHPVGCASAHRLLVRCAEAHPTFGVGDIAPAQQKPAGSADFSWVARVG